MSFVGSKLPESSTAFGVGHASKRAAAIGKPCDDNRDGAGVPGRQRRIDGKYSSPLRGALTGDQQMHLCIVHGKYSLATMCSDALPILSCFGGRPVFEDALAWPAQGVRYWSRSQPLSRSRSFQ